MNPALHTRTRAPGRLPADPERGVRRDSGRAGRGRSRHAAGFTLLEVMIALAIFFMAIFAILDTVSQSLRAARSLQWNVPDASGLAADLMLTNRLEEGVVEGDFGDIYPDFAWTRDIYEVATNGLFEVDFTIQGMRQGRPYQAKTSLLLWRPESQRVLPGLRR